MNRRLKKRNATSADALASRVDLHAGMLRRNQRVWKPVIFGLAIILPFVLVVAWWGIHQSHLSKAQVAFSNGNLAEAAHHYSLAENWEWTGASSRFGLAQIARRNGDPDQAKELLVIAENCGISPDLVRRERELLKLQSGSTEMLEAVNFQIKNSSDVDADQRESHVIGLAVVGQQEQSLEAANRWIEDLPQDARAYQVKAKLLSDNGRVDEALPIFERALSMNPNLVLAREGAANASIQMDLMTEALRHFEILIDQIEDFVTPGDLSATGGDVLFNSKLSRAKIFLELKRQDEAVGQLESLVEEVPDHFMTRFLLATEYSKRGQSERVLEVIAPIQERFPDDVSLNYLLATAESDQGNVARSSELMQKHLKGKEQLEAVKQMELTGRTTELHPQFYREAAKAYLRFQWDAAQPWLERALAIEPNSPEVLRGLADFYHKLGDRRRAERYSLAAEILSRRQVR